MDRLFPTLGWSSCEGNEHACKLGTFRTKFLCYQFHTHESSKSPYAYRLKDQKYAHKKRWADLEEKDWLELEDSYLELFVNAQGKEVWMDGVMASTNGDFEWEGVLQSTGDILRVGTEVQSVVED
ncbi:hypothetical protein FPOAC2_10352 [Fusarium poae]